MPEGVIQRFRLSCHQYVNDSHIYFALPEDSKELVEIAWRQFWDRWGQINRDLILTKWRFYLWWEGLTEELGCLLLCMGFHSLWKSRFSAWGCYWTKVFCWMNMWKQQLGYLLPALAGELAVIRSGQERYCCNSTCPGNISNWLLQYTMWGCP